MEAVILLLILAAPALVFWVHARFFRGRSRVGRWYDRVVSAQGRPREDIGYRSGFGIRVFGTDYALGGELKEQALGRVRIRRQRADEVEALCQFLEGALGATREAEVFRETLMAEGRFVPELALVAECAGERVGHVMLTRLEEGVLSLAPLAVREDWRGRGVGRRLVGEALGAARAGGWRGVVAIGAPGFLAPFGFLPLGHFGLSAAPAYPEPLPQALELCPEGLAPLRGVTLQLR